MANEGVGMTIDREYVNSFADEGMRINGVWVPLYLLDMLLSAAIFSAP